jgi:hypothetical protein
VRKRVALFIVVALATGFLGTIAYALTIQDPATNGFVYACYDTGGKGAGKIKLVNEGTTCPKGQNELSWPIVDEITDLDGTSCQVGADDGTLEISFDANGDGSFRCDVPPPPDECLSLEDDQACDDENACTTSDVCSSQTCSGDAIPVGGVCQNTIPGIGSCPGVIVCDEETGQSCDGPMPAAEHCSNAIDDDCDGDVDTTDSDCPP